MERKATDWRKICAKDISDKSRLSKIYKELLTLNKKKINQLKVIKDLKIPHQRRYTDEK